MTKLQVRMDIRLPSSKNLGVLLVENFVQPSKSSFLQERCSSKSTTQSLPFFQNQHMQAADYRPISCRNVTYKVNSKILAGRLAHVLNDIISLSQNAFLGGRYMADNINLIQELLRQYGRNHVSLDASLR